MIFPLKSEGPQTSTPPKFNPAQKVAFPRPVIAVLTYLAARGKCYLTGGAVRDLMYQRPPADFDLVSDLSPEQIHFAFPRAKAMGNTTKTFILNLDGIEIEITSLQNTESIRIEDNLIKRDLTINAMAIPISLKNGNITLGTLLDPTGKGVEDTVAGVIRFAGKITGARIIRACRLAATLSFAPVIETIKVISNNSKSILDAPPEKVQDELRKILESDNPALGLSIMMETGVFRILMGVDRSPAKARAEKADLLRIAQANKEIRLIVLLSELGYESEDVKGFMDKLRYSNQQIQRAQKLLQALEATSKFFQAMQQSDRAIREIFSRLVGNKEKDQYFNDYIELLKTYYSLSEAMEIRIRNAARSPLSVKELKITGDDIKGQGISKRDIGKALNYLLELVIAHPELNEHETLLTELEAFKIASPEKLN